jgi:hypothetical protein
MIIIIFLHLEENNLKNKIINLKKEKQNIISIKHKELLIKNKCVNYSLIHEELFNKGALFFKRKGLFENPIVNPSMNEYYKKFNKFDTIFSTLKINIKKMKKIYNKISIINDSFDNELIKTAIKIISPYRIISINTDIDSLNINVTNINMNNGDISDFKRLFKQLNKDDLIIFNSSHYCGRLGNVHQFIGWILPILNVGVNVIFPEYIYIPYTYPKEYIFEYLRDFTENECLILYLYGNKNWEIIFPTIYYFRDILKITERGTSFWIKKI